MTSNSTAQGRLAAAAILLLSTLAPLAAAVPASGDAQAAVQAAPLATAEQFRYFQNFTGTTGQSDIDNHWMWNTTNTWWEVGNTNGAYSATPPSLVKSNTPSQKIFWTAVVPGPILSGRLSFKYFCEANTAFAVSVSYSGFAANESAVLSLAGAAAQTQLGYNLTSALLGRSSMYVRIQHSASSAVNSVCSIDDFDVLLNYTASPTPSYAFADSFSRGVNTVWTWSEGYWGISSAAGISDTAPAMAHQATGTTSLWANWGLAVPVTFATLSFHYQCQANAAIQAFVSPDGFAETQVLASARGAAHTAFAYNATAALAGSKGAYVRFAGDATTATSYFCGIDDVVLNVSLAYSTLRVNITSPADGTWTAAPNATLAGAATDPNADLLRFDTTGDFAGGTASNVSITGGVVRHLVPTEAYHYYQGFNTTTGLNYIDDHWMWNSSNTWWDLGNTNGAYSASPPSLVKSNTPNQKIFWTALLPGPLVSGTLSFNYLCEANANLNVWVSGNGFASSESTVLAQAGAISQTTRSYNLTSALSGGTSIYVRIEHWASSASFSVCSIDDFDVVADYERRTTTTVTFSDTFSSGVNAVWTWSEGYWGISSSAGISDTTPAMAHQATGTTALWANWGLVSAIQSSSIAFHYQCQANAAVQAYLSADGVTETRILTSARGAGHTVFSYNATSLLQGSKGAYLRFASDATTTPNYFCGIDDVSVSWTYQGYQNISQNYTGSYLSPAADLEGSVDLLNVTFSGSAPPPSTLAVYFRSSDDNVVFSSWQAVAASGTSPNPATGRYVQFSVEFTSPGGLGAAALDWVRLNFAGVLAVEWSADLAVWAAALGTSSWTADVPLAGGSVNLTVRATDTTGAQSFASITLQRDVFAPTAPGKPQSVALTNVSAVTWTWALSTDVGLGVNHYLIDLGTAANGSDLGAGLIAAGDNYTASGLPDGAVFARVRAVDLAGLVGAFSLSSNGTRVDTTAPGAVSIATPARWVNQLAVAWTWSGPVETGSGVDHFTVRLGSVAGASDYAVVNVSAPAFSYTGAHGATFFLEVVAVDVAGNAGPSAVAGPITIDLVAPTGPAGIQGLPAFTNNSQLVWSWDAATDSVSGVARYHLTLGTSSGASDVAEADYAPVAGTSYTYPAGASGTRYFFSVAAVDAAGNWGAVRRSGGTLVDTVAPVGPASVTSPAAFVNATALAWSWAPASDAQSGLDHYVVRVGSTAGGADLALATVANTTTTYSFGSATSGNTYYFEILAVDGAGNAGARAAGTPVTVDLEPPAAPSLAALPPFATSATLTVTWSAPADRPTTGASGIDHYNVRVNDGRSNVVRTESGLSVVLPLLDGFSYAVGVAAVDRAGNTGPEAVSTFTADRTSPAAPLLLTVTALNPAAPSFQAMWVASTDAASGVREYHVRVGTTPGGSELVSDAVTVLPLYAWNGTFGQTYFVTVYAVDEAGNAGANATTPAGVSVAPPPGTEAGIGGLLIVLLLAAVVGGAAVAFLLLRRRGKSPPAPP